MPFSRFNPTEILQLRKVSAASVTKAELSPNGTLERSAQYRKM